jgi:hypothetical protein
VETSIGPRSVSGRLFGRFVTLGTTLAACCAAKLSIIIALIQLAHLSTRQVTAYLLGRFHQGLIPTPRGPFYLEE